MPLVLPLRSRSSGIGRDGNPASANNIGSRRARQEVYSPNFRQWHFRVAGEQLIYSHVDRVERWDTTSEWRYKLNVVKHLLIGSAQDNFPGSNINDATKKLADLMTATPGTGLFLSNTGHSVHFERPRFLAGEIADFLPWDETPKQEPTEVSLEITDICRAILIAGKGHATAAPGGEAGPTTRKTRRSR